MQKSSEGESGEPGDLEDLRFAFGKETANSDFKSKLKRMRSSSCSDLGNYSSMKHSQTLQIGPDRSSLIKCQKRTSIFANLRAW